MGVAVAGLRCAYGRHEPPVVDIESFAVESGVCGLVGVNGAGKSTLLRTLAGCRRPESGQVHLDGKALYGRDRREVVGRVGYMPQQLDLPREMRVSDAMTYASWVRGVPSATSSARNTGLLERVGLAQQSTRRVGELSGGMNRRLALAVALVTDPDVLLLDEPTTGLHFHDVAKLLEVLHELADAGNTVVVIEHNLEVIKTADWIIDLGPEGGDGGGKIVAAGTPEDVAAVKESYTGRYLKDLLVRRSKGSGTKKQAAE